MQLRWVPLLAATLLPTACHQSRPGASPTAPSPAASAEGFAASLPASPLGRAVPKECGPCKTWNAPREPLRVHGNTYFVGTAGLSSILIQGRAGAVLIDGGLPQSAPQIAESIRKLGFRLREVRLLLNSHAHYDHAGGIAALQRATGARVMASPASRHALLRGEPTEDDPQFGFGHDENSFPPVPKVDALQNGQTLKLGDIEVTAHFTPGHTPGSTSWTWRSCEEHHCVDVVYADSLSAVSAPEFLFNKARATRPANFLASIASVAALPCDILLAPHPEFLRFDEELRALKQTPHTNPFIDSDACKAYAAGARRRLERRIAEESVAPPG